MRTRLALAVVGGAVTVALAAVVAVHESPVDRGLSVEGIVRDTAGRAIPGAGIVREGYRDRTGGTPWWTTDADGRFRIDDLQQGKVALRVMPGAHDLSSPDARVVETAAGTKDLVVEVEPGPQLLLRIASYQPPEGKPRYARLLWHEPGGRRPVRYAPIRSDGWTRFVGLPVDQEFEIWAMAAASRPVREGGIRVGAEERKVVPTEGREIRGRVLVNEGDKRRGVGLGAEAYPGFRVGGTDAAADGSFTISGLPDGTYRVWACISGNPIEVPVAKEVRVGATDVLFDLRR